MKKKYFLFLLVALLLLNRNIFSQQPSMQKTFLNHIALYVTDLKKSTSFYRDVIGLDTIPEPFRDGKHTWFRVGDKSHLHLIEGATVINNHDKNNHLCFSVPSVETFILSLRKMNIEFENWGGEKSVFNTRVDGVKQIYFRDPDGYWLEINDARE